MKRSLAVLGIILLILAGFLCTAAAESLPAPVVTVLPENPDSSSDLIFRFDQVYDEVVFDLYRGGVRETGGRDCLDSTDFRWGRLEAGEWRIEARARMGEVWSETFVLTFTVAQVPLLEPPVILSCPETVQAGQPIPVEYALDENADPFNCSVSLLSAGGDRLGSDNPGEAGLAVFNDWPDTVAPGNYQMRLQAWGAGYEESNSTVIRPITVTESVRPAGPDSITLLLDYEEVQTLATGDTYVLRITAPGAEAVRWELDALMNTVDHSRPIEVNPDGVAEDGLGVASWLRVPELVFKAYALRNGLWSLPVSKTVPLSDVAVAGSVGYTLDPASPRETDFIRVQLDREYEEGGFRLLRDGNDVRSLYWYGGDVLELGELEAGEYTLTGRGYAEGVWTEESAVSFTVAAAESLPAPVVTVIPANPDSSTDVIFRFDQVYDEVQFDLYRNGVRETGGQDCLDSTDFDWGCMKAGEWRIEARARMGDVWSETFVLTFTVTQSSLMAPPILHSLPETVQAGQPIPVAYTLDERADPFNCSVSLLSAAGDVLGFDNPGEAGLAVFNDWPDTVTPGTYQMRFHAWGEGYEESNSTVTWPITVTESVRPAGPDSITLLVDDEEVQTLATGDAYVLRITAPGAEAVRWKLEALTDSDHSKPIEVNPDGVADVNMTVSSWQQPELVLKAYALRNGLWSLPVSKTVPLSDVVVDGSVGYTLTPASPRETDVIWVQLDDEYEKGAFRLLRDGNDVRSLPLQGGRFLELGILEAGEYTVTGRGCAGGIWTEESTFTFTVAAVEKLDPPEIVSLPGSVQVGERFTLTYTADEREQWADLILRDSNGKFVGFGGGSDGLVQFGPWRDDCTAGTYHGELISYSRDSNLGSSQPTSFELTVTDGLRPDGPQITLNPEQPEVGRSSEFVFDRVYEAVSVQLLDADGTLYTTVSDENTDRLTWQSSSPGPWTARASVCVDGIWSFSSDTPFTVLPGSGEPEVRLYAPESVSAGVPFTVSIEAVEDFYYYGVRVKDSAGKQIDESGNSDGNGIVLCERGSKSLDAGDYSFVPWITSMDETIYGDPVPFTVTGERPAAPACSLPTEAAVGESFTVTCDAADADLFELRVRPEGEMQPFFYDLSEASEWTLTLTSSGTYTVECWCRTDGRWSRPMTAEVIVTSAGKLPDPVISGSMSYAEGEDLVFTFASEGAEEYTYIISRPSWGNTRTGTVGPEGILTISTAEDDFFEPAGYNLTVTSHKTGWDPGETVTSFTVGGAPEAPVLTVSMDTVRVGETFTIHIGLGDADELVCDVQYDPSDPGSIGGYGGDASWADTEWDFELPGRHFIRASVTKNGLRSAWSYAYVEVTDGAETLPAPVVTVLPENPDTTSWVIFRFDQVYDEVEFDLYCGGVQENVSGRDFMDSTDFEWGRMRAGEWRIEARARIGEVWSETFVLPFTVTQAPLLEPPVILSCPETVQAGQPIPVEYVLDENADPFNCDVSLLSAGGDLLGFDNPGEAGLAVFNDWPDTVAPGNYQMRLQAWGAGYEESNSTVIRPITVTESVRPAGPDSITLLVDDEEVQSLATGDDYVLRITAPGAEAVRWELETLMNTVDHSRPIEVNPDGVAEDGLGVASWLRVPELVFKAYALRNGLWSLPVSKTVPLSDVAVAGSVGYTLDPASPRETDFIWVQLDREYEKGGFRLLRDGNDVRSLYWYGGDALDLGELEAGEYTLTGRGYAGGVWTEESAVSFTVAAAEILPAPVVTVLPENPDSSSVLTFRFDQVYDEVRFDLYCDGVQDISGRDFMDSTDFLWGTLRPGEWRMEARARIGDIWSETFVLTFTVTQAPLMEPPVILSCPETVQAGQPIPVEYALDERANPFNCGVSLLSAAGDMLGFDNPSEAGLAVFNDWPDTVAPGNYQLQFQAWGAGYEESNSTVTRPITVTESVRPAAPDSITVLLDSQEVQTLATGDDYVLRITAPGADAVRWKLEALMNTDHSRQIPVNPDGFADADMTVSSWQQPELVLKAYALRDGLWSLPVVKTVPLSDVAVAGSVGYILNPASPGEDDVIWIRLDREYEKAAFRLLRDGNCVRSWTWHSGEYLELGELEAGEYTLTGRGYAEGVWTEESAVTFTVAAVERLDPPEIVSLPESVRVGERFTLTYTADEREQWADLILRDSNGKFVGFGGGSDGLVQFGPWRDDCTAGTYHGELISYSRDSNLGSSQPTSFELTVTDGPRPDAPQITLNPEQPEAGRSSEFVFDQVYEAVSVQLLDADGTPYTTVSDENTDRLTWQSSSPGPWTARASVCVDGIWSFSSDTPFTVLPGSGDPEVRLHAPESVSAGMPFTVSIEEVEDFFFYGVIVKDSDGNRIDENGSPDGNGIELCERGSTSLDAGEYTFVPWITSRDETIFGDPIPFTVTGERPAAPACTVPAEAAAGESFTIICDAADADWFELRVKPEGEMEPVFYDLSDASEWTVTLPSSGTYTVECWSSTDGQWSLPMTAEVTATSAGKLPDPVISGSTSYAEGEDLVFTFTSEGAEEYTYVISRPSGWEPRTGTVGPEGILTVSTAGDDFFEPAGYNLTVTSRKAGWDPGETVTSFTVGGAPEAPVLTVSKDTVRVGETFTIHIGLGDADELVCDVQYDPSDPGSIGGYAGGASWADTEWDFDLPGRHFIRASVTKDGLRSAWSYAYVQVTDGSEPVPEADITTNFGSDFERPFIIGMDFEAYTIYPDRVQTDPQIDYFYLNNAEEIAQTEAGDPVWTLDVLTGTAEYGLDPSRYGLDVCLTRIPQQEEDDLLRLTMTWGNVSWERAYIVHFQYSTNGLPTGIVTDLPNPLILRKGDSMDINGRAGFRDNWTPAGLPFSPTWAELEGGAWNASEQDEQGQRYAAYPGVYRDACIVVGCWNVKWAQDLELYVTEENGTLNAADYTPKGTIFTLPAQTQRIEEEAFAGVQMTEVDIPAGVSFIAEDAFEGCGLIAIYTHNNPYVISWAVSHGIIALTD